MDQGFILTVPTIDHVTKAIRKIGFIAKVDKSRAFKHIPIDPKDINLLALFWNSYFIEKNLVFGFKQGSQIFQRCSDSIRYIMTRENHYILNYIDDYLIFGTKQQCTAAFHRLHELLDELGFTISHHKTVAPCNKVICLGILIDSENFTMSVPPEKLDEIRSVVCKWENKSLCTKNQLQSLLGHLLYVSKCVKYARFFINRLLDTLRSCGDKKSITLDCNFHKNINWFKKFVKKFNGKSFFIKNTVDVEIHLDACLKGMGAIFGSQVYHVKAPSYLEENNIAVLEMFNILVALRTWAIKWKNKNIKIFCDNLAVVTVLNNGKTKDKLLAAISRNIFMDAAQFDISLIVSHVAGKTNITADLLSRWGNLDTQIKQLKDLVPNYEWVHIKPEHLLIDHEI